MEKKVIKLLVATDNKDTKILLDLGNGNRDEIIKKIEDVLKEEFQAILDVQNIIAPAIAGKLKTDYDILFITGVGEVYPYIRSHNVLNNLQKFAKDKPLVLFFPGEYTMYEDTSSNLKLFSVLPDDKYYRATNIYEIDEV